MFAHLISKNSSFNAVLFFYLAIVLLNSCKALAFQKFYSYLMKRKQEISRHVGEKIQTPLVMYFGNDLLFDFLSSLDSPLDVLGLNLTGPFDLLNGKIQKENNFSKAELHLHGRFYYDIPEMMTVLYDCSLNNSFHVAYFRYVMFIIVMFYITM